MPVTCASKHIRNDPACALIESGLQSMDDFPHTGVALVTASTAGWLVATRLSHFAVSTAVSHAPQALTGSVIPVVESHGVTYRVLIYFAVMSSAQIASTWSIASCEETVS